MVSLQGTGIIGNQIKPMDSLDASKTTSNVK